MNYNTKLLGMINSVKAIDETSDTLVIEGFANTVTKDRAGDVIPSTAWEAPSALNNYLKNPIILAYHDHKQPIGKMVDWSVTEMGLKIKASISKGAGAIYDLIKEGVLTTFSVGFNILDAEYDNVTDTYFIKSVELHEISVVSVPCNQDSVFSVSKGMDSQDFEKFKINLTPEGDKKEEIIMTLEEMQAMAAQMKLDSQADINASVKAAFNEAEAAKTAAVEKAQKEADANAQKELAIKSSATEAAKSLIADLENTMGQKDAAFAEMVKTNHDQIVALKEEIAQVVAARNNPGLSTITKGMRGATSEKQHGEDADKLVFLSAIKKVGMFETDFGSRIKAVNDQSSLEVSSDGYETTFSTNLARDIQAALVVAPLFAEMSMSSASMTIPVNPDIQTATWVAASALADGADTDRTGAELAIALTERTLKTFKLAAKVYLTEETEEDTIIALVPILRSHLVEAHAKSIDSAFLIGDGNGKPKGLATQANAVAAQTFTTLAKADKTVLVTAKEILAARRGLGLYGINLDQLYVIISQDAYWDLIQDSEWADVQQVGQNNATKLVGEVGNIYGMRVLVSNEFAARANASVYAVICNASNFVVPRQRGVTVRSDFDVETDRTVFVATQRLNLEPLIVASTGNGKGVVSLKFAAA